MERGGMSHRLLDDLKRAVEFGRRRKSPDRVESTIRCVKDDAVGRRFSDEAAEAGMQVEWVDETELPARIGAEISDISPRQRLIEPALVEAFPSLSALEGRGETDRDGLFDAQVGVVFAVGAVAETGSLAFFSGPDAPAGFSLVPMTIVVVLKQSTIVGDWFDWMEACSASQLPGQVVFVSGPSKTADIQMKLVTGVHGPGVVKVFII